MSLRASFLTLIHRTVLLSLLVFVNACATPIGVVRLDTQDMYRGFTANVLSTGEPSDWSAQVLQQLNLYGPFDQDPETALAALHRSIQKQVSEDQLQDRLFALSELSFFHSGSLSTTPDSRFSIPHFSCAARCGTSSWSLIRADKIRLCAGW